jgi:uncharacterized cupredoxin-like copper-binding protein
MTSARSFLFVAALVSACPTFGHGDPAHDGMPDAAARKARAPAVQKDWGVAATSRGASRTIEVTMHDSMRFTPERIELRRGETVRFVVRNNGSAMHEFVIGTRAENDAHAAAMARFPDMQHDEPWMAHVPPGKTGQIVWTFNRAGTFDFACLIAGHAQAGMRGTLVVAAK